MSVQASLFNRALEELESGRDVVRAVIVKTWGSTPRETGADMLVGQDGEIWGTVGGGCGEAEVYELAMQILESSEPESHLLNVDLTENPDDGGGKVCGGRFDVLLQRLTSREHLQLLREACQSFERGGTQWETELRHLKPGFWKQGDSSRSVESRIAVRRGVLTEATWLEEKGVFAEPLGLTRRLVVVGAGHIARPLCSMAAQCAYEVVVLDDRSEFAQSRFFPDASSVLCGEYDEYLPALMGHLTSVVLVTRGHTHDQDCLRLVIDKEFEYLGMIGSQRRVEAVFGELVEEGCPAEALRRVRAPIGLDIGAQSPAEIAVCILAEMIQLRRLGPDSTVAARQRHIRSLRK